MKNLIDAYVAYLKDNPERYWFKRKLYGWGWTPATKEGWAVLIVFLVLIAVNALRLEAPSHSVSDTLLPFLIQTIVLVLILLAICYKKGEKPKWQWGIPKDQGGDRENM